jgi:hypothetical protein
MSEYQHRRCGVIPAQANGLGFRNRELVRAVGPIHPSPLPQNRHPECEMGLRHLSDEKRRIPWQQPFALQQPIPFCHSERSEESAVRLSGAPNLLVCNHLPPCHPDRSGATCGSADPSWRSFARERSASQSSTPNSVWGADRRMTRETAVVEL